MADLIQIVEYIHKWLKADSMLQLKSNLACLHSQK